MHARRVYALTLAGLLLWMGLAPRQALARGPRPAGASLMQRKRGPKPAAVRGRVSVPYVVLYAGTARQVTWYLDEAGPLATGEALSAEEVRAWLKDVERRAGAPGLMLLARRLEGTDGLEAWERQLWRDYLAHVGPGRALTPEGRDTRHLGAEDRRDMALRLALESLLPGMAEELGEALSFEQVAAVVTSTVVVYLAMWAVPEPISKTVALGVTLLMVAAFGAELLAHMVREWKELVAATARARTFEEVKVAGRRFGRELGADGARVLMLLVSLKAGRDVGRVLTKVLPRLPGPPGKVVVEGGPEGTWVRVPGVESVSVAAEGFVVTMAGGAGDAAAGLLGGRRTAQEEPEEGAGPGAGPAGAGVEPSSARLAANMRAAGMAQPPDTAAHHIVAGKSRWAKDAREVLRRFEIDLDDAANGVFLRAHQGVASTGPGATHSTIHTQKYYRAVNDKLARVRTRQDALKALEEIRQALLAGAFP